MTIRVLHTEWADGWGGQEIRILQEMLAMKEAGCDVSIACTSHSNISKYAKENAITTYHLPFKGNTDFKTLWGLRKIIKENKIDIVNTHSGKDTVVGGLAAKLTGRKFIRTRHLSIPTKKSSLMNKLADYIITTGESVKEKMISYTGINPNKIQSITTGIDPTRFNPDHYNRETQRAKFNLKDDEIVLGMIAVLRSWKRHDRLFECAKILIDQGNNIKILLAGDGPNKEAIKNKIKENQLENRVIMLGHVKNPEEVLPAVDFVLSCSDGNEGVSQSVMQALLMSKAVLATNVGSVKDLYHNDNFILTENGAVTDWAASLKNLIDHPEKKKAYEKKARDYVLDNFSKEVMVKKIMAIYQKLLAV